MRSSKRLAWVSTFVLVGLLVLSAVAVAKRRATSREHAAVARAFDRQMPVGCSTVYISTANRTWASLRFHPGAGCDQFASDGQTIFHVERRHWTAVTAGSSFRCPVVSYSGQPSVPQRVVEDLIWSKLHCA